MGCDIHIYTEAKRTVDGKEKWINVDNWRLNPYFQVYKEETEEYNIKPIYCNRNYELFSFLADVRNYGGNKSFGFDRGLPDDISPQTKKEAEYWGIDGHSHGYCTLEELKNAIKGVAKIRYEGAVNKEQAERYRKTKETPTEWAQGVGSFRGIAPEYQDRYEWLVWEDVVGCFEDLVEAIEERKREIFWIFKDEDDLARDKDIRIVFWFDN